MSHAKIALPFNQACKLNDEQKCKLIICQARRISIQEWEIESLLEICKSKGWIDKGLAVLYEYAGYIDDIKSMMEMHNDMYSNLLDEIQVAKDIIDYDYDNFAVTLRNTSIITAKVMYTLCAWRRLQWSPRPVFFEDFVAIGFKLSFQAILRDDSARLFHALITDVDVRGLLDAEKINVDHLVTLLSAGIDYSDLQALIQSSERRDSNGTDHSNSDTSLQQETQLLLTVQHQSLFEGIKSMLIVEDRVESSWRLFRTALPGSLDLYDLFPTLRLPYKNFKPPTEDMAWFGETIAGYSSLAVSLAAVTNNGPGSPVQ